jgi:hypothetical protein
MVCRLGICGVVKQGSVHLLSSACWHRPSNLLTECFGYSRLIVSSWGAEIDGLRDFCCNSSVRRCGWRLLRWNLRSRVVALDVLVVRVSSIVYWALIARLTYV